MSRLKKGEKQSIPNKQRALRILYSMIKNKTLEFSLDEKESRATRQAICNTLRTLLSKKLTLSNQVSLVECQTSSEYLKITFETDDKEKLLTIFTEIFNDEKISDNVYVSHQILLHLIEMKTDKAFLRFHYQEVKV